MAERDYLVDLCLHCKLDLALKGAVLCRECDQVFHAEYCIDLHDCGVCKQKDVAKLAAWTTASEGA